MPRTLTKVRVFNPGRSRITSGRKAAIGYAGLTKREGGSRKIRKALKRGDPFAVAYRKQQSRARLNRTSNPPKRKLSLAQKLHFGTKRQRAAAGLMLSRVGKRKRVVSRRQPNYSFATSAKRDAAKRKRGDSSGLTHRIGMWSGISAKTKYKGQSQLRRNKIRAASRIGNPGEIITLAGLAGNPGRLRKRKVGNVMAKRRTRKFFGVRRRTRSAHNPNVMVRYSRRRRRNTGRVRSMRRSSNPGFLSGGVGMLVGIFGGAALTGAIAARIPGQLSSGIAGYLTTGVVAYAQGTLAGKLLKNPTLGKNMVTGGLIYLGLKIAGDLIPGLSLPFGLSGLGAIGSSNFSYPQIPASNTMLYASPTPVMAAAKGMGRAARMGRGY